MEHTQTLLPYCASNGQQFASQSHICCRSSGQISSFPIVNQSAHDCPWCSVGQDTEAQTAFDVLAGTMYVGM